MGGVASRATRVFRMYNIDNRVDKVLLKDKPTPAPKFESANTESTKKSSKNSAY